MAIIRSEQPIQFSHQIHTVLNQENYLLWKSQVLPVLRGYDLVGFTDGSRSAPARTIISVDAEVVNPEFSKWHQQDQLILAWLFSSISPPILAQVLHAESSEQLWCQLHQIYTSQSLAKVLELKLQLQTLKKGGNTCTQFLQLMQGIADRLRSIGSPVSEQDLVVYTLQGLGSEFDNFVTAFSMRSQATSMAELQSFLLTYEARMQAQLKPITSPSALLTSTSQNSSNTATSSLNETHYTTGPQFRNQYNNRNNQGQYNNYRPPNNGRGRGRFRGRGRGRQFHPNSDTQCQICSFWGHTATECYHRFDIRYVGHTSQQNASTNASPQNAPAAVAQPPHQALVAEPAVNINPTATWFLDSGATTHVTPDINNLSFHQPYKGTDSVHIGNGAGLLITHIGSTTLPTASVPLYLTNVLHVPQITRSLLSVSQLARDNNIIVEFSPGQCFIKDSTTKKILLHGTLHNGLYALQQSHNHQVCQLDTVASTVWHSRLVHCSSSVLSILCKNSSISVKNIGNSFCHDCNKAKAHKLPFSSSQSVTSAPLQLIHTDLWGPSSVVSNNGNRYYVHFIDDYTRFSWYYACASKSDVVRIFDDFKLKVENLLSTSIKTIQCDGGLEFRPLINKYPAITFQISCPHTPQQNGIAERKHRHMVELGLATMYHAHIPLEYWDWIFESTNFVINRLPSQHTVPITPFQKLFNQPPDYNFLKVIGCACYPLLRPYNTNKLQPRSDLCVFMGYSTQHKGYRCLHLPSQRVYISRHVTFNENIFPFTQTVPTNTEPTQVTTSTTLTILPQTEVPVPSDDHSTQADAQQHTPPARPVEPMNTNTHHMLTRQKTKTSKPKRNQVYTATKYPLTPLSDEVEPTCYTTAKQHAHWREAMAAELSALAANATWDLVPLPALTNAVGCKWLFKIKKKSDGSIERYKARLVAKGYTQQEGFDYFETFSHVIKPTTVRTVLSIALSKGWELHQLDVNNAFLHGDLQETVYMEQPPGFADPLKPYYVCKLNKALYGLKQAPRAWFQKLKHFLISHQFKPSQSDHSLFIYMIKDVTIYILVYVDDIIVTGSDKEIIQTLIQALHCNFSIKDLGQLSYFLGIEVTHSITGLHLSQTRYFHSILEKAQMVGVKPCQTPLQAGVQLSKFDGQPLSDPLLYRTIVGMLQYATLTRPDLTFAVNKVSQFFAQPTDSHWQAVKRILRYLKGTIHMGLHFKPSSQLDLQVFCDADWAGCPDDRRSTTGFVVFLGPNVVSWSSKKQSTVSRSSTEAEYRAMAVATAEVMWLNSLLSELGHTVINLPSIWCDNLSATFLAANPIFHARTKHIELDYHFVREQLAAKHLTVHFICSADQVADVLTKSLAKQRFSFLRDKLTVCPNQLSLGGAVNTDEMDDSSSVNNGDNVNR
ncbi:hypothetical protein LUZ63_007786 [Rhynchospora breviuscula]|uniref:Integrase catalytic domain-containing protein n=1 Tax=Rhynchospora breviuscula TaxID=2022672 RepID=A0A9Q0CTK9_9POAL|nr:hypothetical protein LUZ63_007786 [Rhynchospora breviuscula]